MTKKRKYTTKKKRQSSSEEESIEELKNKIKHQKDALNKILKHIQNEKETKD